MSSSNRHWPSMFKSKPCNSQNQWQHEMNSSLGSTGYQRSPFSSAAGEERSPEPKARWNPKPEQIRILEAIFNSGMVNPPRDEIRKIRVQLQEYGQVGDANVFYWFQNRKSRSKHKLRQLQNLKNQNQERTTASLSQITTPPSSSSSSSDKSSSKELVHPKGFSFGFDAVPNSPTASVNQTYFRPHINNDTSLSLPAATEPFSYPMHNYVQAGVATNAIATPGYSLSEFPNSMMQPQQCQQNVGPCTSLLLSEIMNNGIPSKKDQDQDKAFGIMQHQAQLNFSLTSTPTSVPSIAATPISSPYPITQLQGVGEAATDGAKYIVFINDVAFEVAMGPLNVRQLFGDEAMLIQSTGHPVPTDEWGVTLNPLQHGAYYYLI